MVDKGAALSRIVGVEEHFNLPHLLSSIREEAALARGYFSREMPYGRVSLPEKMKELDARLDDLDAVGLTVQVLSLDGPGADLLAPQEGVALAKSANDALAEIVRRHPTRYAGFAHLPLTDPDASADELERAVIDLGFKGALIRGATDGRYLDHSTFDRLLARAASLHAPIYIHPAPSPAPAREALFAGLPGDFSFWLSISGWGWHSDTAIHILRLMLSGAFERHPKLKLIIGHLGEGLQVVMPRLDQQFHDFAGLQSMPSVVLREHVWVGTSGFWIMPSFMAAFNAFGADRILYSTDYPFGNVRGGRKFLEEIPVSPDDLAKITHQNADTLLRLNTPLR